MGDGTVENDEDGIDLPEFSQDEALFAGGDEPADDAPGDDEAGHDRRGMTGGEGPAETVSPAPVGSLPTAPLALYRRYRPDSFADVIGQEHVTEPLQRALTNNRVNHAYLFSGPRGCGKTTSARILARCLNCELGPRAEPCGQCQSCRDLARGGPGSLDVIEIDAASHGGVDDARDLRERAFFAPVSSRYKIYVVDEAHMVTTAGFNALLKLVEEPPPHVKFIFATTEPDKVIGTIRSRTHHYPFRLVPPRVLGGYLAKLCVAEGIAVEPAVLPLVVRAGQGSVRDSLSVLDQLLGGAGEDGVSYGHAAALLGYTPDSLLDEFVDAFAAGDSAGVFGCVDKVIDVGQDPRRFAEDLLRRLRDLLVVVAVPDALTSGLVEVSGDQAERLSAQAATLGAGELTRAAEVIAAGLTEMRGTTAPRLHLELMCARILLPGADVDDRGIHARLDRLERRIGMNAGGPGAAAGGPVGQIGPERPAPTRATAERVTPPADDWPEPVRPGSVRAGSVGSGSSSRPAPDAGVDSESARLAPERESGPPREAARPPASSGPAATTAPSAPPGRTGPRAPTRSGDTGGDNAPAGTTERTGLSVTDVRRLWPEVLEEIKGRRRFTWVLLSQNAHVAEVSDGTLLLAMPNVGARDSFGKAGNEDVLREALIAVLGVDLRITTMVDPSAGGRGSSGAPRSGARPPAAAGSRGAPAAPPGPARESNRPVQTDPPDPPPEDGDEPPPDADQAAPVGDQGAAGHRPVDPAVREQARQSIRPTRRGPREDSADDRDADADRDDAVLDESTESHTELLARQLGAQIIAEEENGT